MTQRETQDPARTARVREEARNLVREHARHGAESGAAGALERAYALGVAEAQAPPSPSASDPDGFVAWSSIPKRPRAAFWTICLFTLGRDRWLVVEGHLLATVTPRGAAGWRLILADTSPHDFHFGRRTLDPLVRLALLRLDGPGSDRLAVSVTGVATWRRFLAVGGWESDDGVRPATTLRRPVAGARCDSRVPGLRSGLIGGRQCDAAGGDGRGRAARPEECSADRGRAG